MATVESVRLLFGMRDPEVRWYRLWPGFAFLSTSEPWHLLGLSVVIDCPVGGGSHVAAEDLAGGTSGMDVFTSGVTVLWVETIWVASSGFIGQFCS